MKNVKYRLLDALVYDYPLIESWLTEQAAQGWFLENASSGPWKFRRGEPKQVRYEVTYAPNASAYNSRPTEAEEDLAQLCADAGWVRVTSMAQLQIFRNDDPNATPIETDEAQRLSNIRRTMWKHFFPAHFALIGLFLLQFYMHLSNAKRWPSLSFSSPLTVATLGMTLTISILYAVMVVMNLLWLRRARKAVEAGLSIPPNSFYRSFRWVMWVPIVIYLLSLLATGDMAIVAMVLGLSAAILFGVWGTMSLCKRLNAPRWANIVVPIVATWAIITMAMTCFAFRFDRTEPELPLPDALPMTLSDLGIGGESEASALQESSSILAAYGRYQDQGDARIRYTVVEVKFPLIYDMILNEQEQNFLRSADYLPAVESIVDQGARWGAEYARHTTTESGDHWLVCWEGRILHLQAGWQLTDEQIAIICKILNPEEN